MDFFAAHQHGMVQAEGAQNLDRGLVISQPSGYSPGGEPDGGAAEADLGVLR